MAPPGNRKAQESPGYCKAEDLVNLFGLPIQSISQLTRDGVLRKEDTPAGKRYNVVRSTRAVIQHLLDKAEGCEGEDTLESKELEKMGAEVRILQAKAEIAELELKERQGWPI